MSDRFWDRVVWSLIAVMFLALLPGGLLLYPKYKVYSATHAGKAALALAENERQVLVEQARAERDAAALRKEAIDMLGAVAQQYPEFRQQEFIAAFAEALEKGQIEQIVYVPTEANIPITEAGARVCGQ